jgi:hypothetical protein
MVLGCLQAPVASLGTGTVSYRGTEPARLQSVPQGSHVHGLLLGGQQVMASLYPDFLKKLESLGAARCRAGTEVAFYLSTGKAFSMTGAVRESRDLGFDIIWFLLLRRRTERPSPSAS